MADLNVSWPGPAQKHILLMRLTFVSRRRTFRCGFCFGRQSEHNAAVMSVYRYVAFAVAGMSTAAMLYVGLYQSRLVGRMICPIFGEGCEGVADAPFARPFGIPDGYIGAVLYAVILALLFAPPSRGVWIALIALSALATVANILGVRDMMNFGSYCFYCVTTTMLSPVLLWSVWELG
jgi:uncharacterized membrane protein